MPVAFEFDFELVYFLIKPRKRPHVYAKLSYTCDVVNYYIHMRRDQLLHTHVTWSTITYTCDVVNYYIHM